MKVFIHTLGCKVNQYESEAMLEQLSSAGFTPCSSAAEGDVILINSCTVTATSDQKVRQVRHRARRQNPHAVIVLTGCMPQAFPEESASLLDADIVLGNSNRSSLLADLQHFFSSHQRVIDIIPHENGSAFESMRVNHFYEHTRAFVKIEDGCNRFCSYCIIPYARGRVRSKPLEELRNELDEIAANGYCEVVLTGINLSAYGQDIGLHLCDAVEAACAVPGIQRVRLGSLEPEQLSEEVIRRLAKQEKLCPQFHLSLQSGCDATLRRMNRHYDTAEYRRIVKNLRGAFENAAITTDIMVAFPGETEEEFESSLAFAKEIGFAKVHVFAYSRRPGTAADSMSGQLTNRCKEERSRRMIDLTAESKAAFFRSQEGRTEKVLFERECGRNVWEGYTMNYTPVRVVSVRPLGGEVLPARLLRAEEDWCVGELV